MTAVVHIGAHTGRNSHSNRCDYCNDCSYVKENSSDEKSQCNVTLRFGSSCISFSIIVLGLHGGSNKFFLSTHVGKEYSYITGIRSNAVINQLMSAFS